MTLVMPTRILVVGSGGREHALAWKLAGEPGVNEIIVAPGSQAIDREPRVRSVPGVDPLDSGAIVAVARREAVELAVIGPEAPLAAGVADALVAAGIPTFGPTAAAARIESSKSFCREIAEAAGVRMARGRAFDDLAAARTFAVELAGSGGVVIKADGLAAGKGVAVCADVTEALDALERLFDGRIVVEERLDGPEASLIALCDGRWAIALPLARDHKRLADGDQGPNTGGMGAYSPLPDLPEERIPELLETIHRPILAELTRRGTPFVGALYAGLMLTADGPVLLECNARFGDPEAQVLLPRLGAALGPWLLAAARGRMRPAAESAATLPALPPAAVAIVLASAGYPEAPRRGDPIDGLDEPGETGAIVFHAATVLDADGGWRTNGGRVLTVVGRGPDLAAARSRAEAAADRISWGGMQRRRDIAGSVPVSSGSAR